ncbi:MAG TPA: peptidoglycan DD-metalloendopeptidase family protein [Gemmatimonadaceae bacterium]
MSNPPPEKSSGYGNIYTPHAGSMIIHVQRESGLANRTIVLTQRQVRLLRRGSYAAAVILVLGAGSWFYLASQAARVPFLTHRIEKLQHDVRRLDTLQVALATLEDRFQQVQKMLGAAPGTSIPTGKPAAIPAATPSGKPAIETAESAPAPTASASTTTPDVTVPDRWPLPVAGERLASTDTTPALDIAVPPGTDVRAAGAGMVVEVKSDPRLGTTVRLSHADGYESLYANITNVRVSKGQHVAAGTVIARTAGAARSLPPHLHFEVRHAGKSVDPASLMKQGPANGDLQ